MKLTLKNTFVLIAKFLILSCFISATAVGLEHYYNSKYFDDFNPPPEKFNTKNSQIGFDSRGNKNPNALQFSGGASVKETPMYDSNGIQLMKGGIPVVTEADRVGYYNGFHNGKILAGAIASININGSKKNCIYLNAVDIKRSGTFSGWVPVDKMSPSSKVWKNSQAINKKRESVRYTKNPRGNSRYERMAVTNKSVPSSMTGGYIIPNRSSSAGKVTYYYIRDGLLNGFVNLPETGKKRHGVQCTRVKPGSFFWRDKDVDNYIQNIYARNSSKIVGTFRWCYGYFVTNAGTKIYSWTNRECLKSEVNTNTVHIKKRNASGFAIDGGNGGAVRRNIYLYRSDSRNVNQQWNEIDRGKGFYSYQKKGTNFCIDGNNGGSNGQNVFLANCRNNNLNQHWKKVNRGNGNFRLEKRNAPGFSLDGGRSGANRQNLKLWASNNANQNQQWTFGNARKASNILERNTEIYTNPTTGILNIDMNEVKTAKVSIYNITGQLIKEQEIKTGNNAIISDALDTGVYIIKINHEDETLVKKIIND